MPDQEHHEDVEHGKQDQSDSVRVGKAVKLIDDKESQDDQRCRIRPELVPEQTDDQEQFDDAVAKQIKGVEILGLNREMLRGGEQAGGDEIVRVADQLFLGQDIDEVFDRVCADQSQNDSSGAFNQCEGALEEDADLKNLVYSFFVHAGGTMTNDRSYRTTRIANSRRSR
jgi:hypothetical protein